MSILTVEGLCKDYGTFKLKNASFSLDEGYIMGFIGRNGAGKSTTLKAMLNLVHKDGGSVTMFGQDFFQQEQQCKQQLGVVLGMADYYPKRKLQEIAQVTRRFYTHWDQETFMGYLQRFSLDPQKRIEQLSSGMRVKFALALALSHDARLLILDEPTSGLDPVSRSDLLVLFRQLVAEGERSILFSTHITSDLDQCADYITYIRQGEILCSQNRESFLDQYRLVRGSAEQAEAYQDLLIGPVQDAFGFTALMATGDIPQDAELVVARPNIENIMVHLERE